MIFRQLFDATSGTDAYLIASRHGGEALIIDPVLERVDRYLQLVRELDLKLVKAVEPRTGAKFCAFPAFWQDRQVARLAAVTLGCSNGRRAAEPFAMR
jgi:hypothetical protein